MHSTATQSPARRLLAGAALVAATLVLAACASTDDEPSASASPNPSGIPAPSQSPGASPSPSAEPEPDEEPGREATPLSISCDQLLTADELYAFNPNVALVSDRTPAAGSPGQRALDAEGVACHVLHLSSNDVIVVAASKPGPSAVASLRTQLDASATPASGLGGDGWFGDGTATVISGDAVVTVTSPLFVEAADAAPLAQAAIAKVS